MIPLPVILAEFVMALGGALFLASAYALIRSRGQVEPPGGEGAPAQEGNDLRDRPQGPHPGARPVARGRVFVQMMIGLVVFVWGLATFLVRLGEG